MKPVEFWQRWALAALALSLFLWFAWPVATEPALVGARQRDDWAGVQLPRWQITVAEAVLAAGASYWGQPPIATQTAAPPADPRWRLAGVVGAEGARRVLISFADASRPNELLSRGDKLPTGHRITKIGERDICVELNKKSYTLSLERLELKE